VGPKTAAIGGFPATTRSQRRDLTEACWLRPLRCLRMEQAFRCSGTDVLKPLRCLAWPSVPAWSPIATSPARSALSRSPRCRRTRRWRRRRISARGHLGRGDPKVIRSKRSSIPFRHRSHYFLPPPQIEIENNQRYHGVS
jgi:hypothetical protein